MNDQLCSKLNDYIAPLRMTNEDQLDLIEKLMNRKKKTIIVNFVPENTSGSHHRPSKILRREMFLNLIHV